MVSYSGQGNSPPYIGRGLNPDDLTHRAFIDAYASASAPIGYGTHSGPHTLFAEIAKSYSLFQQLKAATSTYQTQEIMRLAARNSLDSRIQNTPVFTPRFESITTIPKKQTLKSLLIYAICLKARWKIYS